MVVKGDGSLIEAEVAMACPVETILSGPATSVVGARYLSGEREVFVSDMGGTTTDVALLRDGRPVLNPDGAVVGGWRTMVEAVAVHTYGLGGDSEVRLDETEGLVVGPRRAMPLSLLAQQRPELLDILRAQLEQEPKPAHGRFALRLRALEAGEDSLTTGQRQLWQRMGEGPVPLTEIDTSYVATQSLLRLADRGLVITASFTPSDAAHLLGRQDSWSLEGARLGAALWLRRAPIGGWTPPPSPEAFAAQVAEAVVRQSGRALLSTALAEASDPAIGAAGGFGRMMVDRALSGAPDGAALFASAITLNRPILAIGAPVGAYYDEVARRLHSRAIIPPHADVCNAVGAVAGDHADGDRPHHLALGRPLPRPSPLGQRRLLRAGDRGGARRYARDPPRPRPGAPGRRRGPSGAGDARRQDRHRARRRSRVHRKPDRGDGGGTAEAGAVGAGSTACVLRDARLRRAPQHEVFP
jgi:N-methylhydantoinase A/oxoprolinase/acetone carboxylase beta subunit